LIGNGSLSLSESGIPSISDKSSAVSVLFGKGLVERIGNEAIGARLAGQMAGSKFETVVGEYLETVFPKLKSVRPGRYSVIKGGNRQAIASFAQYSHLSSLSEAIAKDPDLAVAIGLDYLIKPDVMILRHPEADATINNDEVIVDEEAARLTNLRELNGALPSLHASISCKWTMRSDRAQNARSEALNLIRNRKGRLPHIVVVTAEPTPGRLASLALGTGDIDCVYHIALYELQAAIRASPYVDSSELLDMMIDGQRLRDISDMPLDLAI
jgi:hypothetical protein